MAETIPVAGRRGASDFALTVEPSALQAQRQLHGLSVGLIVSLVVHLVVLSILSLLVLEPRILGMTLITSLLPASDEGDIDLLDVPIELAETHPSVFDEQALRPSEAFGVASVSSDVVVPGSGILAGSAGPSGRDAGDSDLMAGFSPMAAGRLKKNASARQGDYEIALFWDGPTDLDLHVQYRSITGKTRVINFITRGSPATGFLDLDQNCEMPYVNEPIEHVRWNTKKPPPGMYQVGVHGFALRSENDRIPSSVSFTVEIKSPDGVKSYSGSVGQDEFEQIDTLDIGLSKEQRQSIETQADRQLASAKEQLESNDMRTRMIARGMLKSIERKYPTSKAAVEARKILQAMN